MDVKNLVGREIYHYRIVDKIGKGGFGYVYQAKNTIPNFEDTVVAIKISRATHDPLKDQNQLLEEARLLRDLKHPFVLRFIDLLPYENHLCLLVEFAAGGSLRNRIGPPPNLLPMPDVLNIISQIGQALQYIHERQIIHRDLKPENILFNSTGEA